MKKKSYNPFKMWGSWVGAGIGLISLSKIGTSNLVCANNFYPINCIDNLLTFFQYFILPISLGFLIGWGIHSLFRKYIK